METQESKVIVETTVNAPLEKTWAYWTEPEHIMKWNNASEDWHTPHSINDLRVGGKFLSRMEARDKSFGFDFEGIYDQVSPNERIAYTLGDGRKVQITFTDLGNATKISEIFDPESTNSVELQRDGWQAILDNFKKYVEDN